LRRRISASLFSAHSVLQAHRNRIGIARPPAGVAHLFFGYRLKFVATLAPRNQPSRDAAARCVIPSRFTLRYIMQFDIQITPRGRGGKLFASSPWRTPFSSHGRTALSTAQSAKTWLPFTSCNVWRAAQFSKKVSESNQSNLPDGCTHERRSSKRTAWSLGRFGLILGADLGRILSSKNVLNRQNLQIEQTEITKKDQYFPVF